MLKSHTQRRIRKASRLRRLSKRAAKRNLNVKEYLAIICYNKAYPIRTAQEIFDEFFN